MPINIKNVLNRTLSGAIGGALQIAAPTVQTAIGSLTSSVINSGLGSALDGALGGTQLANYASNFYNGELADTVPKLSFKTAHPYATYPGILSPLFSTQGLAWLYRPSIDASAMVGYETVSPTHSMQDFKSFRNNSSPTLTVGGPFSAQTIEEGRYLLAAIHFLKTARLMSFGRGGAVPAGMPPPVLNFSGYGKNTFNDIPVVLEGFIQSYPPDVDYISVDNNSVPVVCNLTCTLTVMLSPSELRNFNLDAYAYGSTQHYL